MHVSHAVQHSSCASTMRKTEFSQQQVAALQQVQPAAVLHILIHIVLTEVLQRAPTTNRKLSLASLEASSTDFSSVMFPMNAWPVLPSALRVIKTSNLCMRCRRRQVAVRSVGRQVGEQAHTKVAQAKLRSACDVAHTAALQTAPATAGWMKGIWCKDTRCYSRKHRIC